MPAIKCLQFCIIFAYYFAPRAHAATNFSAANRNQYASAFTKPKALSYFYHHTTPRSPTLQKIFATTPSSGTPHTHVIAATSPCRHTHIMSTMGAMQFARFVQQPFCSLACRIIFLQKKTLSDWLRKSNSLTLQDQSHTSIRLNTPSHSFNPALCNTKHYSPLAEYAVVAIQTKCIYYSTAALAYYPHMC